MSTLHLESSCHGNHRGPARYTQALDRGHTPAAYALLGDQNMGGPKLTGESYLASKFIWNNCNVGSDFFLHRTFRQIKYSSISWQFSLLLPVDLECGITKQAVWVIVSNTIFAPSIIHCHPGWCLQPIILSGNHTNLIQYILFNQLYHLSNDVYKLNNSNKHIQRNPRSFQFFKSNISNLQHLQWILQNSPHLWVLSPAPSHSHSAPSRLAVMHLNGIGTVRNCKLAVDLLKRVPWQISAERGGERKDVPRWVSMLYIVIHTKNLYVSLDLIMYIII